MTTDVIPLNADRRDLSSVCFRLFVLSFLGVGFALGGSTNAAFAAPWNTEDADPVEYGHYEFTGTIKGTVANKSHSADMPSAQIAYGLTPDMEVNVTGKGNYRKVGGESAQYGVGDTELQAKYRFITEDEEGWRPAMALSPTVSIPTGDSKEGLGSGHTSTTLPLSAQKSFGDWTTIVSAAYSVNAHQDDRNFWYYGWVVTNQINEELTVGGELYHQTADCVDGKNLNGLNLGAIYSVSENHKIYALAGRGLTSPNETNKLTYYLGYKYVY